MILSYKRHTGLIGRVDRQWIDTRLPACPFCGQTPAQWEWALEGKVGLNLFHYRCPACHGEVSVPVATVRGPGLTVGSVMYNAMASKCLRIESVGTSSSPLQVGTEISPDELRAMVRR
jgi:hypothetical protein